MNTNLIIKTPTFLAVCAILSACGGGGGGGGNPADPTDNPPQYQKLNSTADTTSILAGAAFLSDNTGALSVAPQSGTVNHATQEIDTGHQGQIDLIELDGDYDYTILYSQNFSENNLNYDATGVGGIVTKSSDMPSTGTLSFTGDSLAILTTANANYEMTGQSAIIVDLGNARVSARMDSFSNINGSNDPAPIDRITIDDMMISGNSFSGGTLSTTYGGSAVDVTGANTQTESLGYFFGYDTATNAPDEMGGTFLSQGDSGILAGGFVAD